MKKLFTAILAFIILSGAMAQAHLDEKYLKERREDKNMESSGKVLDDFFRKRAEAIIKAADKDMKDFNIGLLKDEIKDQDQYITELLGAGKKVYDENKKLLDENKRLSEQIAALELQKNQFIESAQELAVEISSTGDSYKECADKNMELEIDLAEFKKQSNIFNTALNDSGMKKLRKLHREHGKIQRGLQKSLVKGR